MHETSGQQSEGRGVSFQIGGNVEADGFGEGGQRPRLVNGQRISEKVEPLVTRSLDECLSLGIGNPFGKRSG